MIHLPDASNKYNLQILFLKLIESSLVRVMAEV